MREVLQRIKLMTSRRGDWLPGHRDAVGLTRFAIRRRVAVLWTRRMSGEEAMWRDAVGKWCGQPAVFWSFVQDSKPKTSCKSMLSLTLVLDGRAEEALDFERSCKGASATL